MENNDGEMEEYLKDVEAQHQELVIRETHSFWKSHIHHLKVNSDTLEEDLYHRNLSLGQFLKSGAGLNIKERINQRLSSPEVKRGDPGLYSYKQNLQNLVTQFNAGIVGEELNLKAPEELTIHDVYQLAKEGETNVQTLNKWGYLSSLIKSKEGTMFTKVIARDKSIQAAITTLGSLINADLQKSNLNKPNEPASLTLSRFHSILKKENITLEHIAASPLFDQMVEERQGAQIIRHNQLIKGCEWEKIYNLVTSSPENKLKMNSRKVPNDPNNLLMLDNELKSLGSHTFPMVGMEVFGPLLESYGVTEKQFAPFCTYERHGESQYKCLTEDVKAHIQQIILKINEEKRQHLLISKGKQPSITEHFQQAKLREGTTAPNPEKEVQITLEVGLGGCADGRSSNETAKTVNLEGKVCKECGNPAQNAVQEYLTEEWTYVCWQCQTVEST